MRTAGALVAVALAAAAVGVVLSQRQASTTNRAEEIRLCDEELVTSDSASAFQYRGFTQGDAEWWYLRPSEPSQPAALPVAEEGTHPQLFEIAAEAFDEHNRDSVVTVELKPGCTVFATFSDTLDVELPQSDRWSLALLESRE